MQFLINTFTHWDEPPRARHHVAKALALHDEVVFVSANKFGLPGLKTFRDGNILVVVPYFPVINKIRYRAFFLNEFYQNWLFRRLVKKYKDYQVINFDFTATRIFNYFNNVIYFCNDSFVAISKHLNPSVIVSYHERCESTVASRSVFCIAVSRILRDNLARYNERSFEIPLGSPVVDDYKIEVNENTGHNETINVGVMGVIRLYNISEVAINSILERENMKVTLIGPVEDSFMKSIVRKDKITMTGTLTGRKLYEEINKFDVALAPYNKRLTSDPKSGVGTGSKIYHYFAMGKPVVISAMEGLKNIEFPDGFLYIASDEKEFPDLVNQSFKENSKEKIQERMKYASENSWESRMKQLKEYIKTYIADTQFKTNS